MDNHTSEFDIIKVREKWGRICDFMKEDGHEVKKDEGLSKTDEDHRASFYDYLDGFSGLNQRLRKRLEIVDEEGDLSIVSNADEEQLVCKVDSFIWNLWRKQDTTTASEDDGLIVHSGRISTSTSKPALKSVINFMYLGDLMCEDLSVLFEVAENKDDRNTVIPQHAQQLIFSKFSLEALKTVWSSLHYHNSIKNELLILHSLGFILSYPEEVFRAEHDGDELFVLPKELLERLQPSQITYILEELNASGTRQWNPKTRIGKNGTCYLDTDHADLSEYLFKWALHQQNQNDFTQPLNGDGSGICYSNIEEILGDFTDILEAEAFDVSTAKKPGRKYDLSPDRFAKGVFYFSVLVLNKEMEDLKKQTTIIYPFSVMKPPCSVVQKRPVPTNLQMEAVRDAKRIKRNSRQLALCGNDGNTEPVHPIIRLLEEENERKLLVDVTFYVEDIMIRVFAHSFLLSLWSSTFATKLCTFHEHDKWISVGLNGIQGMGDFVKAIYTGRLGAEADIVTFMKLASIFRIPAFIRMGIERFRKIPLAPSNCILRWLVETLNGDDAIASGIKRFVKENLKSALAEGDLDVLADKAFIIEIIKLDRADDTEFDLLKSIYRWCLLHYGSEKAARTEMKNTFCKLLNLAKLEEYQLVAVTEEKIVPLKIAIKFATERGKYLEKRQQK